MGLQGVHGKKFEWPAWHFSVGQLLFLPAVLFPAVINLLVWQFFVVPPQKKIASLGSLAVLVKLKPRMEALIAESNEMAEGVVKNLSANDADEVLKEIRELAEVHMVEIKELFIQNTDTAQGPVPDKVLKAAGFKRIPVSLDVTGNYARIARWLAALDQKMEIRVDSFTLTHSSGEGCQLRLGLRILLRNS